jgi:hypothetical protein
MEPREIFKTTTTTWYTFIFLYLISSDHRGISVTITTCDAARVASYLKIGIIKII